MFINTMPRYEILSPDAIAVLDRGWRRIVSQIGVQFAKPEAVELFAKAGQRVDGEVVYLDPDFVMEQVAKAPREFDMQARNPANNVHIGGNHMVFSAVYGSPFVRQGDVRRDATLQDFRNLASLSQVLPRARLGGRGDLRAERRAAGLAAPGHDLRAADADRQDLHGQRGLRAERRRHHRDDRDLVRRPGEHRADARRGLADQLQLPAALGRSHAGRPVRVQRGGPAGRLDPVPAHGRHVPGDDPGGPGAAARRGAVRDRAGPADPARDAR